MMETVTVGEEQHLAHGAAGGDEAEVSPAVRHMLVAVDQPRVPRSG